MYKLTSILFIFINITCFSQEKRNIFKGIIQDDLGELPNTHIINTSTNKATFSLNKGYFEILAKIGDTLKITSIGYKTKLLKVEPQHFGIKTTIINLEKDIIELNEVNIKEHNLTGNLSTDIKQVKNKKEINAQTLKLPNANLKKLTSIEKKFRTASGSPIDFILNSLTGKRKKLKEIQKIEDTEKEITKLKNTFKHNIISNLKISEGNFYRFLYFVLNDKNYKKVKQNKMELIKLLQKKAIEFKKQNKVNK